MSAEFSYQPAVLVLSDGRAFHGRSVGAEVEAVGVVRFNTAQTGSFEALTAPDNAGALLAFTTPHIGNTGVADPEAKATVAGVIMRDPSRLASHWDSRGELDPYLIENGVPAISHIDTRALMRHAGANYRADDAPVFAGIFTGERARTPIADLVAELAELKTTAEKKGL